MKAVLLFLCGSVALLGQPTITTVTDTIYNSVTGSPFNGTIIVQGPNITQGGTTILGISRTVQVVNGSFSVALVPNTTALPAQSTYSLTFSNGDQKTCTVPVSGSPVTLQGANCMDGTQTAPLTVVALSQLAGGGATTNQALCWNGTQWAPGNCGGSSGGTVTTVGSGDLSPLFTSTVSNPTTTPSITFTLDTFLADRIFGNFTGSTATPGTQAIPACANDGAHALVYVSHVLTCESITASGATIAHTTNALVGDGAGNGVAASGAGTNCLLVNGSSAACAAGGTYTADGVTLNLSGGNVFSANTAIMGSRITEAGGSDTAMVCSGSTNAALTCSPHGNILTAYADGMAIRVKPDVTTAGSGETINISNLGAVPLYQSDGATAPNPAQVSSGTGNEFSANFNGSLNSGGTPPGAFVLIGPALPNSPPTNSVVCYKAGGGLGWASNTAGVIGTTCN